MRIRITSAIEGFRRAGISHPRKPADYPDGFFTEDQLAQLVAEPRLVVEQLPDANQSDQGASPQGAVEPYSVPGVVDNTSTGEIGEGENLLQPLIDIISKLDPTDEALWNKDLSPKASNFPVGTKAEDRASAWEFYQTGQAALDSQDQDA